MNIFHKTSKVQTVILRCWPALKLNWFKIGFPTQRDSATFWDKGTEGPSLSLDKGTTRQAQILPRAGTGRNSLSKSGTGHGTGQSLFFCQNPVRYAELVNILFYWQKNIYYIIGAIKTCGWYISNLLFEDQKCLF